MSECSTSPSDHHDIQPPPKRKAAQAGLDGATTGRSVKRRASKACQCCRARKVRCNVTEHGAPCTNCRLDEVECIVSESRRKKSVHAFSIRWPLSDALSADNTNVVPANVVMRSRLCTTELFRQPLVARSISHGSWNCLSAHHSLIPPHQKYGNLLTFVGNGIRTTNTLLRMLRSQSQTPIVSSLRVRP